MAGTGAAGAGAVVGRSTGVAGAGAAPAWPPMMTRSAPTGTVSSSPTRILVTVPATGDGISVSTLSVETSSNGSSTSICSPSALSQRVTVPSVTDSPSAGIVTVVPPATSPPVAGAAWTGASAGASTTGAWAAGWDTASGAAGAAGAGSTAGCAAGADVAAGAAAPSPMTARSVPTGTVSSSATRISCSVPATGEGISVSTLSVDTSSNGSSMATESPTFFSQRVTVPSVTDSPRAGMVTRSDMG